MVSNKNRSSDAGKGAFFAAKQSPAELFKQFGKFPCELEPFIGEEVTVTAYGSKPNKAILGKGPLSYVIRNKTTTLQIYVGEPVTIVAPDGTTVDFETYRM